MGRTAAECGGRGARSERNLKGMKLSLMFAHELLHERKGGAPGAAAARAAARASRSESKK